MNFDALNAIAKAMVAPGRGLLAADESTGTIKKRFDSIGVENTEANRQTYRDMLFTTEGFEQYTSGVILFEETLFQKSLDGQSFSDLLQSKGVIPGIKVDKGAQPLANAHEDETVTEGLDGLRARLEKYHAAGARFAKWRAVINSGRWSLAVLLSRVALQTARVMPLPTVMRVVALTGLPQALACGQATSMLHVPESPAAFEVKACTSS